MDSDIADIRAFNRFYTRQIGLLEEHVAQSRFSLPEGRLLYEIATRGRTTAAELSRELGVDRAYVSRMLQKFVAEGLVAASPSKTDRRRNDLTLTTAGGAAFEELDGATRAGIAALVAPLDPARRQELLAAMQTIRAILGEGTDRRPVVLRPHRLGELGWLIHRQGRLYNQQYGWNGDFEALIARIYCEYHFAPDAPPKALWVAEQDGAVAGSIFCMPQEGIEGAAQLRMLYVEPHARGQGIGGMLVGHCVDFARGAGYERIRLWTHSVQEAARQVYARAGFAIVEEWDHQSFGKDLHAEIWELQF